MIITILGLVLLAALVLWVVNIGQQVNHRMQTQDAADAVAQAGAGWTARSLNTIAMNNVDIARYIAAIGNLDAFPQAIDMANREEHSLTEALQNQMQRGITGGTPASLYTTVTDYYNQLLSQMQNEIAQMDPIENIFDARDVREMTFYSQNGGLWRAMYALDETSQAIAENLTTMAQTAALRGGEVNAVSTPSSGQGSEGNQTGSDSGVAIVAAQVPVKRGAFNDFQKPVMQGLLPDGVDNKEINRGPWDAVFGWRDIQTELSGGTYVPGGTEVTGGGSGPGNPLSRGGGSTGRVVGATRTPIAYSAYGPYSWMRRRISAWVAANMPQSRLNTYHNRIAAVKMNQLWPGSTAIPEIIDPDWRITYEEAKQIADAGTPTIRETCYFVLEIKSRYAPDDPNFMTPGSWALETRGNQGVNPRAQRVHRWLDMANYAKMICDTVFRDDWNYMVNWDNTIGITPVYTTEVDDDGETHQRIVPQPVYRVDHFVFGGVNVGPDTEVRNPWEGFNTGSPDSPAPIDLDHSVVVQNDAAARAAYLSFLGIARTSDIPQAWPARFRGGRPYSNAVAIAQAKVFNNHSWDLWTPMWRTQLEPVSDYDGWLSRMQASMAASQQTDLTDLQTYLQNSRDINTLNVGVRSDGYTVLGH
jgi:hypothetical protein